MASNINYASIDNTYPIAGKDNDSQGFRDNFGYIKNSLEAAKNEIDTLQQNSATTAADNDFNNNSISKANFIDCGEVKHTGGIVSANAVINYYDGSVQEFKVNANLSFTLQGFPATGTSAKMRLYLNSDGSSRNITFQVSGGSLKKNSGTNNPIAVSSQDNITVVEFVTFDHGVTVFMNYIGTFS